MDNVVLDTRDKHARFRALRRCAVVVVELLRH